jgi:Sec-independent protein translocase protein TatA
VLASAAVDILLILIVILVVVIVWRGPKTLPLIGRAFGQGVNEARKEIDGMKSDIAEDNAAKDQGTPPNPPA